MNYISKKCIQGGDILGNRHCNPFNIVEIYDFVTFLFLKYLSFHYLDKFDSPRGTFVRPLRVHIFMIWLKRAFISSNFVTLMQIQDRSDENKEFHTWVWKNGKNVLISLIVQCPDLVARIQEKFPAILKYWYSFRSNS